MRFVESLALWLSQFEFPDERSIAYNWVRSKLVFLSNAEITHIVSMAFPDVIRPILLHKAAVILNLPSSRIKTIVNSVEYKVLMRQSLFLGLSDGARTDLFRRLNPELSHEQVWQTYEVSPPKAEDMLSRLGDDLKKLLARDPTNEERCFHLLFLLDDFSASGISYLRRSADGMEFEGKIHKVLQTVSADLKSLFSAHDLQIYVVLYVATQKSLTHINLLLDEWFKGNGNRYVCHLQPVYSLSDSFSGVSDQEPTFIDLLKKYFDPGIINDHYRKGKQDNPYLGFDECALPLVLTHNCPNNSIPLLWFEEGRKYRGLFPRISRHKQ
jgi:hypothetical protein